MTTPTSIASLRDELLLALSRRDLVPLQVKADLANRFGNSILGPLWLLARPLTLVLIYTVIFGFIFGARFSVENYSVFIYAGLWAWIFFSGIHSWLAHYLLTNRGLALQVRYPFLLGPPVALASASVDFVLMGVIGLPLAFYLGTGPNLELILPFFGGVTLLATAAIGTGLITASLATSGRDVVHASDTGILILFWFTPIVYPVQQLQTLLAGHTVLEFLVPCLPNIAGVDLVRSLLWHSQGHHPTLTLTQYGISAMLAVSMVFIGSLRISNTAQLVVERG